MTSESRHHLRRRILKPGKIMFNSGNSVIDCVIRNISAVGAALEVVTSVGIPEHFSLAIEGEEPARPSRVVWRKATRVGVRFES